LYIKESGVFAVIADNNDYYLRGGVLLLCWLKQGKGVAK
jgi:hypothetical protein